MSAESVSSGAPRDEEGGRPVGLQEMMDARERRFLNRRRLLPPDSEGLVLLQICINIPGEKKNGPMIREIYREALESLRSIAPDRLRGRESHEDYPTGPEGCLLFNMEAEDLKRLSSRLEEEHPLGRLWDMDIFTPEGRQISRRDLGLPPRRCFLCGEAAPDCARSRRHSVTELREYIKKLYLAHKG